MELKTAWVSRTSIGSDSENNLVHVETVDTVESSSLPETSSPKQASNGHEQSKHEAEIETVPVEKGWLVTFRCITNHKAETLPEIKENGGITVLYLVKRKIHKESRLSFEWILNDERKDEMNSKKEITIECTSDLKIILRIFYKKSRNKPKTEIETKAWQLKVTNRDDQSDEQQGSSKDVQSNEQQGSSKDDESDEQQGSSKDDLWDVCEVKQGPWKGVDYHKNDGVDKANKLLRIVFHFLIFLIVTACSITSIGSLQILLSLLGNENMQRKEMTHSRGIITVYLFLILAVPDFIAVLYFGQRLCLKKHEHKRNKVAGERRFVVKEENGENTTSNNKASGIISVVEEIFHCIGINGLVFVVTEIFHCIGINGLVYFVYPFLSSVEMFSVPVAFAWLLAIGYAINAKNAKIPDKCIKIKDKRQISNALNITSAILHCLATISILSLITYIKSDQVNWWTIVFMWISAVLVPLRWSRNFKCCGKDYLSKLQFGVSIVRVIISLAMFFCNLLWVQLVPIPFSFEIAFSNTQNSGFIYNWTSVYTKECTSWLFEYMMHTNPENASLHYFVSGLFLIHLVVTYLLYYFAVLACRICMQKFCFLAPLFIAEFILYPIFLFVRFDQEISCQLFIHEYILLAPFYVSCVCQLWILNHLFIKQTKVMPFAKSLFTLPNYCSPIAVLSLLHSRKIEDTDNNVKIDENKINHQTNPSSSRNGEIENQPEGIKIESESRTSNTDGNKINHQTNPSSSRNGEIENQPGRTKMESESQTSYKDGNKINDQKNPSYSRNGEIENQPEGIKIESESQTSNIPRPCVINKSTLLSTNSRTPESTTTKQKPVAQNVDNKDYDTMIYICATMWHETMEEMKNLIFSILRLDYDHALISNSRLIEEYQAEDKELFQFEGHIFFDDAFECNKRKDGQKNVNKFVRQLKFAIGQAVSQFYNSDVKLEKPKCLNTLYGKRLEWKLPGQNSLFIHLKDKDKIRHKKRWSQVMYLYYLLGFKLIQSNASDICDTKIDKQEIKVKNKKFSKKVK